MMPTLFTDAHRARLLTDLATGNFDDAAQQDAVSALLAAYEALVAREDFLSTERATMMPFLRGIEAKLHAAEARVAALDQYTHHRWNCDKTHPHCSCGLDTARLGPVAEPGRPHTKANIEIARLRHALNVYGFHLPTCEVMDDVGHDIHCTCGWDAMETGLRETSHE